MVTRYPGATFLGSGGYHHHLGTNIWNSRGAPVRAEPTTGLADVEIVTDAGTLRPCAPAAPEQAAEASPARLPLRDPWGTSITSSPAEAVNGCLCGRHRLEEKTSCS